MTTSMGMDQGHVTEKIINLTLEIIYLLTGESFPPVKSGGQVTITVPPPHCLTPERNKEKKVLKVIQKMIGLLTGENECIGDYNIIIKEEYQDEDEEYGVTDPPNNMSPSERCPRPLYSRDSTQEDQEIPHHHQAEDLMNMKSESEEETSVGDDQQYTEEAGMMRTFIEEDTPTQISTGHSMEKPSKDRLTLSPDCKIKAMAGDCVGEETISSAMDRPSDPSDSEPPVIVFVHQRSHKEQKLHSCSDCGKSFIRNSLLVRHKRSHTGEKPYSCPQCGKSYSQKSQLVRHERCHSGEMPYCCSECGNCYPLKSELVTHQRTHSLENLYSCPECGKSYPQKSVLVRHQRSHTGEKPYSCSECGKSFFQNYHLYRHQKSHTGVKPYSCSECGKSFSQESHLYRHQKSHTGQKPYHCLQCGKCFLQKFHLDRHQRCHTNLT
ncbi:uncharacterized protein [Pyxicephalus adspersus]|uniref:uncharacterized protein n=1 Tax=Pyxicephalus adspersus TaxID=30357 RepID=UPI003B5C8A1F